MQENKIVSNNQQTDKTSIRILFAEDNSFERLAIQDLLQLCGYEVTAVENGRLARDKLLQENQHFDLVLVDSMMPEMDGLELLKQIKSLDKLKDIPVIIISDDYDKNNHEQTCLQNGAIDYLYKPLRIKVAQGIGKYVNQQKILLPSRGLRLDNQYIDMNKPEKQENKIVEQNDLQKKLKIHVLVAEDDPFQRLALIDILELCEYEVTAVENGRLARDELLKENQHFDLVLVELMMPEMDGLQLLKLIKSVDKLKALPVIIISNDGEQDHVITSLQNGAADYLVKPLRIQMIKGLRNHVKQSEQQSTNKMSIQGIQKNKTVEKNVLQKKFKIHVLVAEDDQFQRLVIIDVLKLCKYEVTAVENGRLARDELLKDNKHFDIILLDLMMPEMDGLELLKLIKSVDKLKNIPVIMISVEGDQDVVVACLQSGAADYLVKPLYIKMITGISKHINIQNNEQK